MVLVLSVSADQYGLACSKFLAESAYARYLLADSGKLGEVEVSIANTLAAFSSIKVSCSIGSIDTYGATPTRPTTTTAAPVATSGSMVKVSFLISFGSLCCVFFHDSTASGPTICKYVSASEVL
jgi:hypothetical protein